MGEFLSGRRIDNGVRGLANRFGDWRNIFGLPKGQAVPKGLPKSLTYSTMKQNSALNNMPRVAESVGGLASAAPAVVTNKIAKLMKAKKLGRFPEMVKSHQEAAALGKVYPLKELNRVMKKEYKLEAELTKKGRSYIDTDMNKYLKFGARKNDESKK